MPSGLSSRSALRWATLVLCAGAVYVSWPMWPALVLAAWTSALMQPLVQRTQRALGGRARAAGLLVAMLFVVVMTPIALTSLGVYVGARDMFEALASSPSARGALESMVSGGGSTDGAWWPSNTSEVLGLVRRYGTEGLQMLGNIAGVAARGLLVVFVYFTAAFMFILEGRREWTWIERHSPLRPEHLDRFMAAFHETGRGLLVGVGLTSLVQGLAASLAYFALGVPQAWVLGPITGIASVIPLLGSALIWVPIAIGLLLTGHAVKAAILVVVGLAVISSIDNVLRPVFARMGALQMPMLVLFVSIFGGLIVLGTWGAIMGPLVVRLAMEALVILKEDDGDPATS